MKLKNNYFKSHKNIALIILILYFFCFISDNLLAFSNDQNVNPGLITLCKIMIFLQGRITRALAIITIMIESWNFITAGAKWQTIATLVVGLSLFFVPKTMALYILPDTITGITGDGYSATTTYTPDQIISRICPDLR